MEKVVVIGYPGTGVEEFGKILSKHTGLPYHDINEAFYLQEEDSGKTFSFDDRVREITKSQAWVIAGLYVDSSLEIRLEEGDTIFFLDYPLQLCQELITKNPNGALTSGTMTKIHRDTGPKILKMLEKCSEKNIIIFNNEEEKDNFVNTFLS